MCLSELHVSVVDHTVSVVALTFSLKPRLSALDFVSQLWRKINQEQKPWVQGWWTLTDLLIHTNMLTT